MTGQGGVGYFLWTEVFSTESKVTYFNRAVDRIKKDPRCRELLGDSKKITAHGEETDNKWKRARPIAYVDPYPAVNLMATTNEMNLSFDGLQVIGEDRPSG